jgi:Tfp pilus assembly protein PilF
VTFYGAEDRAEQIRTAEAAVSRVLALAPHNADAHFTRGTVLCAQRVPKCARREFDHAIELNCNLARAHGYRGLVEILLGCAEATEPHVARAMQLSPRDPMYAAWILMIGIADLYLGRLEQALDHLLNSVAINPNCGWAQVARAVALGLADHDAEAAEVYALARKLAPGFTIAKYRREAMSNHPVYMAQRERFCAGLRRIGVRED